MISLPFEEADTRGSEALPAVFVVVPTDMFFSRRGRHTRCLSDWSSDVCSSDLVQRDLGRTVDWGLTTAAERLPGISGHYASCLSESHSVVGTSVARGQRRS